MNVAAAIALTLCVVGGLIIIFSNMFARDERLEDLERRVKALEER